MKNFIIVQVDYEYCNYLRKFDEKVPYNSGIKRNRPFVGVLFSVDNIEYFTPLSSPKEKHKKMKNTIDFIKIDKGRLGAINFNNMIPVNKNVYEEIDLEIKCKNNTEYKYYHLLLMQLIWLNKNKETIKKRALALYNNYKLGSLNPKIYNRCCNFSILEEKCLEYKETIPS